MDNILQEYDINKSLFVSFANTVEGLVNNLLTEHGYDIHSTFSRIKDRDSLQAKISKFEDKYEILDDIKDIAGVRIITFFPDDVDKIAEMIEGEFNVNTDHSIDKRKILEPDRFGYLSFHYVVKLTDERLKLTEFKKYNECEVEIQIRSILQHAWAEIEHDLGYKSKDAIPSDVRRRFSRLAGLLELADSEFGQIRDYLVKYRADVTKKLSEDPEEVAINTDSLAVFILNDSSLLELDQSIVESVNSKVSNSIDAGYFIDSIIFLGFNNVSQIKSALEENKEYILSFAKIWASSNVTYSRGVGLFYLCYIVIAKEQSLERLVEYLKVSKIANPNESTLELAQRIVKSFEIIEKEIEGR